MENEITVGDSREHSRYEAHDADGNLMGFADYRLSGATITFVHAETLPEYRGRGVAGRIARKSLDDAREAGLRVKPACPFYRDYLSEHQEYADLVDADGPDTLDAEELEGADADEEGTVAR
ncbi:N-acetyltransferase [Kribbella sp. NBC_01245]|uniref:GNAT family N-acetyltransferase n=1 Tax=Kribbella sp. NBC_01245 TaxID=2903578 RepID=UPI002E2C7729|nr:GNAT family N-acetyltransferase [Kribbella sp. NBC_01245]